MGRPSTSCIGCARRKIRCDKKKPQCGNCCDRKIACESFPPKRFRILCERRIAQPSSASQSRSENELESTSSRSLMYLPAVRPQSPIDSVDLNSHHLQIFARAPSPGSRSKMEAVLLPCMMEMSEACRNTFLLATRSHYDTMRNINVPCQDVLKLKEKCLKLLQRDIIEWKYSPALGFAIANLAGASFIYSLPDEHGQYARAQTALQSLIMDEVGTEGMMQRSPFDLILLKAVILNMTFPTLFTGDIFQSPFALCDYSDKWPRTDPGDRHVRESPFYCTANFSTLKGASNPAMLGLLRLVRKCLDCVTEDMNSAKCELFFSCETQIREQPSRPSDPEYESIRLASIIVLEALTQGVSLPEVAEGLDYVRQLRKYLERSELQQCWSEEKMGVLWWVLIVGSIASVQQDLHRPFFWSWLQFMSIQFLGGQPNWWSMIVPVRRMRVVVQVALQGLLGPRAYQSGHPEDQEDTQGSPANVDQPINSYANAYA